MSIPKQKSLFIQLMFFFNYICLLTEFIESDSMCLEDFQTNA